MRRRGFDLWSLFYGEFWLTFLRRVRPKSTPPLAILASTEASPVGTIRDSLPRLVPGENPYAGVGLVLCVHGQPRHSYVFHGLFADLVLERISKLRTGVGQLQ